MDRRDEELLERALLALAHDGDGGQDRRDDLQEDRDEAGDDVVGRPPVGVEEDDRLDAEAALRGRRPGPRDRVREVLRREPADRGERLRAHGRVRAVDEHQDLRRLLARALVVVVGRDHDADASAAGGDLARARRAGWA